jgi:Tfp pilus assembly protein PilZ
MISDTSPSEQSTPDDQVLKIRFQSKKAFQDAIAHNLDSSGLYLSTKASFEAGHKFQIEIDLPKDKKWIKGMCEVVWVNQKETKDYPKWIYEAQILRDIAPHQLYQGMRIRFVEMPSKYRKRIQECLHAIKEERKPNGARPSRPKRPRSRVKTKALRRPRDSSGSGRGASPLMGIPDTAMACGKG